MPFKSTKTFTHEEGLSCCFRQWRAKSHCAYLHGYALAVKFEFGAMDLDENGWVVDFGSFGPIREWLREKFDHKLVVAEDDYELGAFRSLECVQLVVLPAVGCEAFAKYIFDHTEKWLISSVGRRVLLNFVEVREHGGNSAIYSRV